MVVQLLAAIAFAPPQLPDIAFQLEAMVMSDQEVRNRLIEFMQPGHLQGEKGQAMIHELLAEDARNTAQLKEWVGQYGWLTASLVGKDGAHNAWLIVQHADQNKPFQKQCLALMAKYLGTGEIKDTDYAYLWDRVATGEGRKQRYGTQMRQVNGKFEPMPCEDMRNLDRRRASIGMMSMAEYIKIIEQTYGPPKSD